MSVWFVYIVRCEDKSLYTGISNDLILRIKKHNAGTGAKYTRSRRPVKIVWSKAMRTPRAARQLEVKIKSWRKTQKELFVKREHGK